MIKTILFSFMLLLAAPAQNISAQAKTSTRCEATTQQGTRCKNKTVNNTKYCQVHQSKLKAPVKCKAKTQENKRCSRDATKAGYCTQHYKMYAKGKK